MPPSIQAQTFEHNKRITKWKEERARRGKLLSLIAKGHSALKASQKARVSKCTATSREIVAVPGKSVGIMKMVDAEERS